MRVTVLIANYNYGKYLKKAVDSCLSQTVKPNAICIVDDASTDNSWQVISELCNVNLRENVSVPTPKGDTIVKIGHIDDVDIIGIKSPGNFGPSTARNLGIQVTLDATDIYAILDADDEMLPNKIEECLKPFEDDKVGVVYANYYHINSQTGVSIKEIKEPYDRLRLYESCIVHSGSLIRAEYLKMVKENDGFYDIKMRVCEDYELWIRLAKVCTFYHIPLFLTNVLIHTQNSTFSVNKQIWEQNWNYINQKHFSS